MKKKLNVFSLVLFAILIISLNLIIITASCSDSDLGKNHQVKGTTSGNGFLGNYKGKFHSF